MGSTGVRAQGQGVRKGEKGVGNRLQFQVNQGSIYWAFEALTR